MNRITLKEFEVLNTATPSVPGEQWSVKCFEKKLSLKIIKKNGMDIEFDMVGVDPSLPNALRRILISEVPSMAIEKVHIFNNTSIIQVMT